MTYIVFGKESCNYCTLAKALLDNNDIEYSYKDVTDADNMKNLLDLAEVSGVVVKTVPQIFIADDYKYTYIGGYKELSETLK